MHPSTRRAAIVVVALALAIAACGGDPTDQGSQAAGSPSATPSMSEGQTSPEPSASATATPSGSAPSPDATPDTGTALAIDGLARTTVEGVRIREAPGTAATSLGTLAGGATSFVVDGPVSADGHEWYLLSGLGLPQASGCAGPLVTEPWECPVWFGWAAAAGDADGAWLEETPPDCPAWPTDGLTDDLVFGIQRVAYLACFGGETRSTIGFFPEIPDDAGLGGACAEVPAEMAWIGCNLGYLHIVPDDSTGFFGPGLVLAVDESVVPMPERGQWIRVTGRYDHPAAQDCTWGDAPEQTVLSCRSEFAVESATPVAAP